MTNQEMIKLILEKVTYLEERSKQMDIDLKKAVDKFAVDMKQGGKDEDAGRC
jgi:hypothetical protein